uniref:22alpha-hydroxysteroid 23-monooxygenase n=1 Tax=Cucumis melo subsp. melo TaxID=412675 RepID=E5GCA5_CUCME|nr:cytochrome p450 [Cucumis melo subsp. melo]
MDSLWDVLVVTAITIILYRNCFRLLRSKFCNQLPLGSLGWPFIGETIEFISCAYSDRPETFMDKRRRLYGKVFKSHIFGSPTIVSTDAEVSKFILQSDAKAFVPSYPKSLTELMGKSSILLINGSLQKRIHGLVGAFFKSSHLKAQITKDMECYVKLSMASWTENNPIYLQDETKNISFQVLVKILISLNPGQSMEFLKKQFQEFIAGLMALPVNIPGSRLYQSLQAKRNMVKLVKKIIQERKSCGISTVPKDVMEVLLKDENEELTDDLIAENMIDMMIPGEDSVPILMTLAVKYLSDCPAALQQLTEENLKMKGQKEQLGEALHWSDYLSMPFTQSVITETLRMGNIIIGVMRKAMKDMKIKGYLILKGWSVLTYFRSVHLDDNHYDCPYKFNPWRWQERELSSCNFTPFGGGQRLCPGLDLARLEASIFLHHFVTHFRFQLLTDEAFHPSVRFTNFPPLSPSSSPNLLFIIDGISAAASMTSYGTIPTSTAPGTSSDLDFVSRGKQRLKAGLATRVPWRLMFDFHSFTLPFNFHETFSRIKTNIVYFRMNYVIIVLLILFFSLIWHPISLIVFTAMLAVWLFLYFLRDEPLILFGRLINDRLVMAVLSVFTLVFLFLTKATLNILLSLLIGAVLVLIHAALRKTDDLFLDEGATTVYTFGSDAPGTSVSLYSS